MLHKQVVHTANKWKLTLLEPSLAPKHNLPKLADEYNLFSLLGYNGKFPWFVIHKADKCYQQKWIDKLTKRFVDYNENLDLREISAPIPALKELQGRLASLILAKLPQHKANYAYMKGRNIRMAAESQLDGEILIRIDLKDFFGSHYEPYVRNRLVELTGYSKEICWVITKLCSLNGSLPQGAVTSPILSIVLNYDMDERLSDLAAEHNLKYVRYADDLCFSGVDRDSVYINQFIREAAHTIHPFKVNWDKVAVMRNSTYSYPCGLEISGFPTESADQICEILGTMDAMGRLKLEVKSSKIVVAGNKPLDDAYLANTESTLKRTYPDINVRHRRWYVQNIKRMLGLHLTNGVRYPRQKFNQLRLEAMLYAKGAPNINKQKFKGKLSFLRMVDPEKAAKIDAIVSKHGVNKGRSELNEINEINKSNGINESIN